MDPNVVIPKDGSEITEKWIEENTGLKPVEGSVTVDGNIQAGVGFLSNLCRVAFKNVNGNEEHILVKLLPESPEYLALTIDQDFDKIEVHFYNLVKPEILKVAPELEINLCKDYGGKFTKDGDNYRSMIILEDLKPAGYAMLDPEGEDWELNLRKGLTFLAQLHAAGLVLEKNNNKKIPEIFPFRMGVGADESKANTLWELAVTNQQRMLEFLKKFDCPEEIQQSFARLSGKMEGVIRKVLKKGVEYPVLCHSDVWPPNVLVAGPDAPIKLIDWQILGYRDAAYELTPYILTSVAATAIDKDVIDKFGRFYFREFMKASEEKGLGNPLNRGEEEFMEFFNTWGMAYGFLWLVWSLDSFPNKPERLYQGFKLVEEKYDVVNFLLRDDN